ncbi:BTB/POZ domain-containing protein At3g05675-like [Tasmannia lanceolata]|uniref:BTB/POZ domain-containing protein At3g05675-like n=1 Tax=Tasmannia lanceolata TaxID=3420 RepID=UPI004064BD17
MIGQKKRQRVGSSSRISSSSSIDFPKPDGSLTETSAKPLLPSIPGGFNDPLTADVILSLQIDSDSDDSDHSSHHLHLHLHSNVLRRSKYFDALLSDRWQTNSADDDDRTFRINLKAASASMDPYLTLLQLLYSNDFSTAILTPSIALSLLPVALHLLFDECIRACIQFLEAVPWSEDEEKAILTIIPSLGHEESRELLARVSPPRNNSSEEMLHRLITASIGNHPYVASAKVKSFVAKMLKDFPSRDSVRRVFDRAFEASLKTVKESLEKYSSPDFRGDHDETEAIQRLNLHTAVYHGKDLLWLVERMIELRIGDTAVKEWSEQVSFVADLLRAFHDDVWRNIAPGLPALVLRCTARLADAVATGSVLAAREVRLKLVSVWLPVLIVCREKNVSPIPSGQKQLYQELEETFLRIISTLPMSDAELLLHHCLSFATRNVEDCPHLVSAFNTWFRRATRPPHDNENAT